MTSVPTSRRPRPFGTSAVRARPPAVWRRYETTVPRKAACSIWAASPGVPHTAGVQGRIGLPIVFEADLAERLPIEVEDVLYRVAQEALHNIVKHASARQVRLGLTQTNGSVRLQVTDDGKGFDPAAVPDGHLGLAGMRARAEKVGAAFEVRSRPGSGTSIEIVVPVGSAVDPAGTPAE